MIRATLVYFFVGFYLLIMAPIAILWTIISRDTTFIYQAAFVCLRVAGWLSGLKVLVRGKEKLLPGQTYFFLSNHQANFDGPIICWATYRDLRAVVKKEMMSIPMLSLVLKTVKFVPIDRTDPARSRASIDRGAQLLREGYSFFGFPEGTRSRDGRLGPFKKGVFLMALKAGVPVVPTSLINTEKIQPPGSYSIRPGTVEVIFHDPIPTDNLRIENRDLLVESTRTAIAAGLRSTYPDAAG